MWEKSNRRIRSAATRGEEPTQKMTNGVRDQIENVEALRLKSNTRKY